MNERRYDPGYLSRKNICLGKAGTGGALRLVFGCEAWLAEYPEAEITLHYTLPDGSTRKPVLGKEGTDRIWAIGLDDTAKAGSGVIELILTDSETGTRIKSATGYTTVFPSLSCGMEDEPSEAGYVRYDVVQDLTEEDKERARRNIGAGTGEGSGASGPISWNDLTDRPFAKRKPLNRSLFRRLPSLLKMDSMKARKHL